MTTSSPKPPKFPEEILVDQMKKLIAACSVLERNRATSIEPIAIDISKQAVEAFIFVIEARTLHKLLASIVECDDKTQLLFELASHIKANMESVDTLNEQIANIASVHKADLSFTRPTPPTKRS